MDDITIYFLYFFQSTVIILNYLDNEKILILGSKVRVRKKIIKIFQNS